MDKSMDRNGRKATMQDSAGRAPGGGTGAGGDRRGGRPRRGLHQSRPDPVGLARASARETGWLDDADRELLSLWWLVATGHLTRTEMVAAIGWDPQLKNAGSSR